MKILLFLIFICGFTQSAFADKIKIVTSTSTFASIAQEIAQDLAEIYTVASPNQNIHFVAPTPKDVLKTRKADVFIHGGLDLEVWRAPLLEASGRGDFISGEKSVDVSHEIALLEIPSDISRFEGDVHVFGNPHYWLDPENGKFIAKNITEKLAALYPQHADLFRQNEAAFERKLNSKIKEWQERLAPYHGQLVVSYHKSWPYFMKRFGFQILGFLEPKPGIPPTPKHLIEIMSQMRERNAKVIVREIYQEKNTPEKVAKKTGASVVTLICEPGQIDTDYLGLFDHNVSELEKAFRKS